VRPTNVTSGLSPDLACDGGATPGCYLLGMNESVRVEQLFVVRIWREAGARDRSFRGSVVHVSTERRTYFSELADLVEFVRLHLESKDDR
jgi:hypothetical protein